LLFTGRGPYRDTIEDRRSDVGRNSTQTDQKIGVRETASTVVLQSASSMNVNDLGLLGSFPIRATAYILGNLATS
jgi:hypothetical protein